MLYKTSCLLLGALALCCGAFGASVGVDDVIKLQKSAVGDDVLTAFVQDSAVAYDLSAEDIQQLEDATVPSTVIVAMLDHGKQLRGAPAELPVASASPPVAEAAAASPSAVEPAPTPSAVVYAPAPNQANISLFYEALAPYGTWSQDAGNGWVWEPTDGVRVADWRPYANNGHWAWTDHGWYWESDSPYGWATFHYGRWGYNSRHRWSWAPDNVWGPAWVDWRQSEDYYGWAPLPFGSRFEAGVGFSLNGVNVGFDFNAGLGQSYYNFVPCGNFLDINLGLVLVPEGRRGDFYNRTRVVNNTYVYNNNRIVNNGVPMAAVQRATNRKIVPVTVVDANIAAGQPIRGERRSANTIQVYRPKLANVAPVEPPVMVARQKAAALHASAAVTAGDRKAATVDRQAAAQAASRRLAEEKALLKDKKTSSAVERKAEAETNKAPKVDASYVNKQAAAERSAANKEAAAERSTANKEAATERKSATEAEKQATEKVRQAKAEATVREKASEQRQPSKPEAQPHAANNEAATERKAATETSRESKQNAAEERQSASKEAAAERSAANREAATERKAATETSRESKQNAAEERQSASKEASAERSAANREAATERKAATETSRESKQNAAEEKTHEKK